jgi:transcriptional regulator with XRE-family HTH domain
VTDSPTTPDAATLGAVFKRMRGDRPVRVIARAARVTENTLRNVERGEHRRPHEATLHAIATALGTTLIDVYLECQRETSRS